MKPLKNNVVVEYVHAKKVTDSGIILTRSDEAARGKVLNIGPEVTEVAVGEEVCVDWNTAKKIDHDTYLVSVNNIVFVYEQDD